MLATALALHAQTGTLTGHVTDAESGKPLYGATIRVSGSDATTRQSGAISGPDGRYEVRGLPPGRYSVTVTFLSYAPFERPDVTIGPGATATLDASMRQTSLGLGDVVVSASRRPEKSTEAPASVSVVDARRIQEQPALTPIEHIKGVQGVDIVQSGLTTSNVVTRGFNNAFSGTLMVLTDNRIASVPSLRVNEYNFIPVVNDDIQQIEIIRGPGSALYGPNTANGVMQIITRSPFSSAGTWLSVTGGGRSVLQGMFRHAGVLGDKLGYKISGQYMRGNDWPFVDTAETSARAAFLADPANAGVNPDTVKIAMRDSIVERFGAEARIDYMPTEDLTAILTAGINQAIRNTDVTGVGGAQAKDWRYMYYQARLLYKDLFLQAFLNQSDAGKSYLLRTGQPVVDRSTLFVAQAQHSYKVADIERLTYGADLLLTNPVTDSTITGMNEGDDNTTEFGVYLQSETEVIAKMLDLVVAGRFDKHSRLDDPIISPRAALVYNPMENQTLRLTYNRAYSAPTTNDLFLDIVANRASPTIPFNVRASSAPENGFHFTTDAQGNPSFHSYALFGANPATPIPMAGAAQAMWPVIQALVKPRIAALDTNFKNGIDAIPAPPAGSVGAELRVLNPATQGFDSFTGLRDWSRVRPTIVSTVELGYSGIIADRISLSVDLYRSQYDDFIGPLQVITPNVFLQQAALQTYLLPVLTEALKQQGGDPTLAPLYAGVLASNIAGIPLGTVTPDGVADPSAVMLTYINYGKITLYGYDIGLQVGVANGVTVNGSLSYVDKNFFKNLDSIADLALNAPKFKFSVGASYRNADLGLDANARFRHVDGFPVNSGVYIGSVPGYSVVDLDLGYQIPMIEGLGLTVSAQNLLTFVDGGNDGPFDQKHREFVGVPDLGMLVLGRLTYAFR
jgi:iron complex outermembrane receptor protein